MEDQEKLCEQAVSIARKVVRAMVLCTCTAYERLEDFPKLIDEIEDMSTPLGKKYVMRCLPIITRRKDSVESFAKDMMLMARDVLQEHFDDNSSTV